MQPEQARFLFSYLLPQLKSEKAVTSRILASVPQDQADYQPDPKAMSALQLARHLVLCEIWFLDAIITGQFEDILPAAEDFETPGKIVRWYEDNFARRMPLLEALPGEQLATPVDYIGLRNDPAVAYLNIAIRHSVHHRGQLSAYLRAMGASVPAIYVESADEPYPPADGSTATVPPPAF